MDAQQLQNLRIELCNQLPSLVTRKKAVMVTGNIFNERTLANLDAQHKGPQRKIRIGKTIAYPREDFLDFFMDKIWHSANPSHLSYTRGIDHVKELFNE